MTDKIKIHPVIATTLSEQHRPAAKLNAWQWNRDNVDFSRQLQYETPIHDRFDPDFIPLWKEPLESTEDPEIEETWVVKPGRAGGSECLFLSKIRKCVADDPEQLLYMTANHALSRKFLEDRIKVSLMCAKSTAAKLARATERDGVLHFDDMTLTVGCPKSTTSFKQDGYSLVLGDEISKWPVYATDMLRGRTDTYGFTHVAGISSLDATSKLPTADDPIWIEYQAGDQRHWFVKDPKTGKMFVFEMGGPDTDFGLKWSKKAKRSDGSWDLDAVEESAHYVTPFGTKIQNKNRMDIVRDGKWRATNDKASKRIRSYRFNTFCLPFKKGDFGRIARRFLDAKTKGPRKLKVFIYEDLVEPWKDDVESSNDSQLAKCERDYPKKTKISESKKYANIYVGKEPTVLGTIDVQKTHLWYCFREWFAPGDSGLVDYGHCVGFEDFEQIADRYSTRKVGVDYGYERRRFEVFEYALTFKAWPLMGRDSTSSGFHLPFKKQMVDPYEGKTGQGRHKISIFQFSADAFGSLTLDMISGVSEKNWQIYRSIENEYAKQVTSMECVNGIWQTKKGQPNNHLWDCEVMQVVMATILGLHRTEWNIIA